MIRPAQVFTSLNAGWFAQISVGEEQNAGRILAYQVSRSSLRWNSKPFHHFLDIPSHDNCNVANAVFDRHGQLKRHLYGTFGAETNQGELLYIRDVQMKPQFRKQGLASLALKYLLRQLSQRQKDYAQPTEWWFAGQQLCLIGYKSMLHYDLPLAITQASFEYPWVHTSSCLRTMPSSGIPMLAYAWHASSPMPSALFCDPERFASHST